MSAEAESVSSSGVLRTGATRREVTALVVIALFTRLLVYVVVDYHVRADAATYDRLATGLLEHRTFTLSASPPFEPTMYRPPGYPAFMAAVYFVFGHHYAAIKLVQMALSAVTALVLARVCQKHEPGTGRWVLALYALCPFDAVYSIALLSENLCGTLLALSLAAWVSLEGNRRFLVAGLLLGGATLVRDIYIALVPFMAAAWFLFGVGSWRRRLAQGAMFALCAALVIAPWTARNFAVSGRLVPVSAGRLGFSLWIGGWTTRGSQIRDLPSGERVYAPEAYLDDEERRSIANSASLTLSQQDAMYKRWFFRRVSREPAKVLGRWLVREPQLWLGTRFDIFDLHPRVFPYGSKQWMLVKLALFGLNTLYVACGLFGAFLAIRRKHELRWFVVPLVFTALVYMPLNSFENRYSMPVFPLLIGLGAYALEAAARRWRDRRRSPESVAA